MKLISCQINNFGKLSNFSMSFSDGLNVIKEDNSFGKSTLAAFIKAMLFGLEDTKKTKLDENDRRKYEPWQGGAWGGSLDFSADGKSYRIERSFSKKASADSCTVYDIATGKELPFPDVEIGEVIFGIDRDGFERTVLLSERELSEKCDNKTIAAKLSDLSGVEGDISVLDDALKALDEERKYLYKMGGGGKIGEVRETIFLLEEKKRHLEDLAIRHDTQRIEIESLKEETEILRQRAAEEKSAFEKNAVRRELYKNYREKTAAYENEKSKLCELANIFADGRPKKDDLYEIEASAREIKRLSSLLAQQQSNDASLERTELSRLVKEADKIQSLKENLQNRSSKSDTGSGRSSKKLLLCTASLFVILLSVVLGVFVHPALFATAAIGVLTLALLLLIQKKSVKASEKSIENGLLNEISVREKSLKLQLAKYIPDVSDIKDSVSWLEARLCEKEALEKTLGEYKSALSDEEKRTANFKKKFPVITRISLSEISALLSDYEISEKMLFKMGAELRDMQEKYSFGQTDSESALHENQENSAQSALLEHEKLLTLMKNKYRMDDLTLEELDDVNAEAERLSDEEAALEKRLFIVKKTKEFLECAKDNMNSKYLGNTRKSFEKYASLISGEYAEFSLDTSFSLMKREGGQSKPRDAYSKGLRDMYAFALRLALIDSLYEAEKPFIIIDDAFAYFDDKKSEAAKEVLKKLSKDIQIIYLTASESRIPR